MLKLAVITNATKDKGLATAIWIARFLCGKAEIYMSEDCRADADLAVIYLPYEEIFKTVDIVIVIGGDGTLLRIAPRCAENNIPALGINLGTIGFLTEVEITDIEAALSCVLKGEYITEKRMLLKVRINDEKTAYHALNDVVMLKPDRLKLINIDLYSNSELVFRYRADGLIIATPTGSTGYSVSAGGPVVDPSMQLYIATPICAHMLGARSAVLSSDKELVLRLSESNTETGAIISTDGEQQRIISTDDKVRISKSDYEFELIKIGKTSFYNTLIDKLS